jgi:alpha-N-acetylglucosaminidase
MMRVYDTAADINPFYRRTGYFAGTDWMFGILHSFQGDDHLHGDMPGILRALQELARDPKAVRCRGIYHVPETSGHNLLYFELTTHAAWQPEGMTVDGFLRDYAARRYGAGLGDRMLPALQALARAVYSGGGETPIYKKLGCGYGPQWWPIVGDRQVGDGPEPMPASVPDLGRAIELARACGPAAWREPFLVTDLVDWARTYLAHLCNWKTRDAFRALRQGDAPRAERSAAAVVGCLRGIEALLASRPEFSLQRQIERVTRVPGTNPDTAWLMKKHCVNDLYSANDVYEQMHWFYRPRMEAYLQELRARASDGRRTMQWSDIEPRCAQIEKRWLAEGIAVPPGARPGLTARQAVERAAALGAGLTDASPGR